MCVWVSIKAGFLLKIFYCLSVSYGPATKKLISTFGNLGLVWFKKMVTHHSVFITHHFKHPTPFGTLTHLSSLNISQLFVGPIPVSYVAFTFFFFLKPPIPKLTKPNEKKKERKELKTEPVKKKKKKRRRRRNPETRRIEDQTSEKKKWKKKKTEPREERNKNKK